MPFDSNGIYSLPSGYLAVTGQDILSTQHNAPLEDIAKALSSAMLRTGVSPMLANLNLNGFKVTGLADPVADGDAVSKGVLDDAVDDLGADRTVTTKSGDYTATDTDYNALLRFTAAATLTNSDTSVLRADWAISVWADGGNVTIDPYQDHTINGQATLILQNQQKAIIFRTSATTFLAMVYDDSTAGPVILGMINGLASAINAGDPTYRVDIANGAAASDESVPHLMILPSGLTKRMDSGWAVGNGNGGLDVGTIGDGTYYMWLIQRPDTLVTDVLFSLSASNPTMPTGYTRKRLITTVVRLTGVILTVGASAYEAARQFNVQSNTGELGTHAFLRKLTAGIANPGDIVSGLALEWSNASGAATGVGPGATAWRCLGLCNGGTATPAAVTLFKRIS